MKKIKIVLKKYPAMIISFIIIACMLFCYIFQKDKKISDLEQRNLQQIPHYKTSLFVSGDYQNEYQSYVQDQLPLRDTLFQGKVQFEYLLGKRKFDDVWIGKNNMLFQDMYIPTQSDIIKRKNIIDSFINKYKNLHIGIVLVNNKADIYKENLPQNVKFLNQNKIINQFYDMFKNKNINTIRLNDVFVSHKDENIFYNSDHHWTTRGAYIAFQQIEKEFIKVKKSIDYDAYVINDKFNGSLSKRSGYMTTKKDKVEVYLPKSKEDEVDVIVNYVNQKKKKATVFNVDKAVSSNPYEVFLGGNYDCIEIDTSTKNNKSLLLIKDSFANCLVPFLLPYYHHITIIDPRYYTDDIDVLIKDNKISDVLFLYNFQTFFQDKNILELFY